MGILSQTAFVLCYPGLKNESTNAQLSVFSCIFTSIQVQSFALLDIISI